MLVLLLLLLVFLLFLFLLLLFGFLAALWSVGKRSSSEDPCPGHPDGSSKNASPSLPLRAAHHIPPWPRRPQQKKKTNKTLRAKLQNKPNAKWSHRSVLQNTVPPKKRPFLVVSHQRGDPHPHRFSSTFSSFSCFFLELDVSGLLETFWCYSWKGGGEIWSDSVSS